MKAPKSETSSLFESLIQEVESRFPKKIFLTLEEVVQILDCSKDTVERWAKRSDPAKRPPRVLVGREVRFPKREFVKWLTSQQSASGC